MRESHDAPSACNTSDRFEEFVGLVSALEKEIQRIRAEECAKLGIKGADLMCLYHLRASAAGLTGAELARRSGVTRAAVSRSLGNLEREGLVKIGLASGAGDEGPDAPDEDAGASRYRAPVRLTELGDALMDEAEHAIARVVSAVDPALDDDERTRLYDSLAAVLALLREVDRT